MWLEVVELITSRVNNTQEYVTTREIREVSIFAFSVLINAMRSFKLSVFLQITLQAIIDWCGKFLKMLPYESSQVKGCDWSRLGTPVFTRLGALP